MFIQRRKAFLQLLNDAIKRNKTNQKITNVDRIKIIQRFQDLLDKPPDKIDKERYFFTNVWEEKDNNCLSYCLWKMFRQTTTLLKELFVIPKSNRKYQDSLKPTNQLKTSPSYDRLLTL